MCRTWCCPALPAAGAVHGAHQPAHAAAHQGPQVWRRHPLWGDGARLAVGAWSGLPAARPVSPRVARRGGGRACGGGAGVGTCPRDTACMREEAPARLPPPAASTPRQTSSWLPPPTRSPTHPRAAFTRVRTTQSWTYAPTAACSSARSTSRRQQQVRGGQTTSQAPGVPSRTRQDGRSATSCQQPHACAALPALHADVTGVRATSGERGGRGTTVCRLCESGEQAAGSGGPACLGCPPALSPPMGAHTQHARPLSRSRCGPAHSVWLTLLL